MTATNPIVVLLTSGWASGARSSSRSLAGEIGARSSVDCCGVDLSHTVGRTATYRVATRGGPLTEGELETLRDAAAISPERRCVLVANDPAAASVAAAASRQIGDSCSTAAMIGSLVVDPEWISQPLDLYLVVDLAMARELADRSIDADSIVPIGPPLCGGFAAGACQLREEMRSQQRLEPETRTILLATEACSADGVVRALDSLERLSGWQVVVDMAEDLEMRRAVGEAGLDVAPNVKLLGKERSAPELWACADVVAVKSVDKLISRALCFGRPMLLLEPDGPRSRQMARQLERRAIGLGVDRCEQLGQALSDLVSSGKWDELARRAAKHLRTDSTRRAACALAQLAGASPTHRGAEP